jgi:hypothetical protein
MFHYSLSIAVDHNDDDDDDPDTYSELHALLKPGPGENPQYMDVDEDGNASDYDDEDIVDKAKDVNWQSSWKELNFSDDKLKVHSFIKNICR